VVASESVDADARADSDDSSSTSSKSEAADVIASSSPAAAEESGNLDRFLASTTPSVPVRSSSQVFLTLTLLA
jgi:hypothetical protein